MTHDVSWPKVSEGGKVVGKEEIRAYWTRQWGEFDPLVEPLAMTEEDGGKTRVRVHQLVKSLQGDVLSDSEVLHVFSVNSGLIAAMDLGDEADPTAGPSAAFAHRSYPGVATPNVKNRTLRAGLPHINPGNKERTDVSFS
jgi:hypothetical protein